MRRQTERAKAEAAGKVVACPHGVTEFIVAQELMCIRRDGLTQTQSWKGRPSTRDGCTRKAFIQCKGDFYRAILMWQRARS